MTRSTAIRLLATVGAAAAAVALVVWSGDREVPPSTQAPPPVPAPAQTETCAQRLAKLGQALRLYADDSDGEFPVGETPAAADAWLPGRLKAGTVTPADLRCPTAGRAGPPYVYHCYETLGEGNWPRWMAPEHLVTADSDADTWLASDFLQRDGPGPHSTTEKAFNYLTVDGRVSFHTGRPRDVYK